MEIRKMFSGLPFIGRLGTRRLASLAPIRFPSLLTAENLPALLKFEVAGRLKFVFHKPTELLAIGRVLAEHCSIGSEVIKRPEVSVKNHPDVIGGYLAFETIMTGELYKFRVDALSGFYGFKGEKLPEVVEYLKDIFHANHYKVKDEETITYPNREKAVVLYIERTGLFSFFS